MSMLIRPKSQPGPAGRSTAAQKPTSPRPKPPPSSVLAAAPLAAALALFSSQIEAQSIVPGDPGASPAPKVAPHSPHSPHQAGGGADVALTLTREAGPVGLWLTIDDLTGKPRSLVRILEAGDGTLVGRIEKILDPAVDHPNPVCERCDDDRRNQPIVGLEIIRGLKPQGGHWADGRILNPEDGKIYHLKATPVDAGNKLEMRGYIGLPVFGRTQTWIREP